MSIYKPQGSRFWWYAVFVPGTKKRYLRGSTGTENKQNALGIENTIRLAQRRAAPAEQLHKLIDVLSGATRKTTSLPIENLWTEYDRIFSESGKRLARRTYTDRRRIIARLINWLEKYRPTIKDTTDIDKDTARAFSGHLVTSSVKSKTRKNLLGYLSTIWETLGNIHDGLGNPWPSTIPEVHDSERGKAFSREEEASILRTADNAGIGWGLMCRIARNTGLRYGDIAALKWTDIDATAKALTLKPSKTQRYGISVRLPLSAIVFSEIQKEQEHATSEYLFPEHKKHMVSVPFSSVLEAAGLGGHGFTFHSWRHTFRTRLAEAGVSDDIAKRLGGWTQDKTAERYDHADRLEEIRKAVESAQ